MNSTPAPDSIDFSTRLHELRGNELQGLPENARTVLHGGASGGWYFRWFEENYKGTVERHIGVEAFGERPADVPLNVDWLQRTLGDMGPVPTGSVDLVFAGQVIEHLWPDDVTDFLVESHRVLRRDGIIALDSPNRRVTEAIGWYQPEHTAEFSTDEIAQAITLAGFEIEQLRGVILSYDRARHAFLDLEDQSVPWDKRMALAVDRPEDSFVWWLVARRTDADPDIGALRALIGAQAEAFRSRRLQQLRSDFPIQRDAGHVAHVSSQHKQDGLLVSSRPSPVDSGDWCVSFKLRSEGSVPPTLTVARFEVTSDSGATRHAQREIVARDLAPDGAWTTVDLRFRLAEMTMGIEIQIVTQGHAQLGAQIHMDLHRPGDVAMSRCHDDMPKYAPEPRTLEIIGTLGRRAATKAKAAIVRR
jgi:SAM-dependent methyltransferase